MSDERTFHVNDSCPDCGARIGVLNSIVQEDVRVRYIGCRTCGWRPSENKQVVPLHHAPRRGPRMRRLNLRRTG